MQSIHDLSQSQLFSKLDEKLRQMGISDDSIRALIDGLRAEDLFRTHNTHTLKTDLRRKTVFKSQFNYVEPVPICLGQNEAGKDSFAYYVPIDQTLNALFQSQSVFEQYKQVHAHTETDNVFQDVWDGENVTNNTLKKYGSLGLILYQDVLAVYLSLADLLPYNRSNTDQMQLVLLCKEKDFKHFGQDLVLGRLVKDLKELEKSGIVLPNGQVCKGILHSICGDNLGSHNIGGFFENFSTSVHFCRYCEMEREKFHADPLTRAATRTVQSYREHVQRIEGGLAHSGGIKFDSLFNEFSYFHVCQPGLPPCIGHDLFEGIVSADLSLYIQHLVKVNKQFK